MKDHLITKNIKFTFMYKTCSLGKEEIPQKLYKTKTYTVAERW